MQNAKILSIIQIHLLLKTWCPQ